MPYVYSIFWGDDCDRHRLRVGPIYDSWDNVKIALKNLIEKDREKEYTNWEETSGTCVFETDNYCGDDLEFTDEIGNILSIKKYFMHKEYDICPVEFSCDICSSY